MLNEYTEKKETNEDTRVDVSIIYMKTKGAVNGMKGVWVVLIV